MNRLQVLGTVAMSLAVLLAGSSIAPAAVRAIANEWVTCEADAKVWLYTDSTRTTLADSWRVIAPTQHKVGTSYFILGDGGAPGVEVEGSVTGTPYIFWFKTDSKQPGIPGDASVRNSYQRWRVQAADGGFVADSPSRRVIVAVDGERIVYQSFGPTQHGLFLSGFISIDCPEF